jgi:DNA mismatch repair protein MutL
LSDKIKILPQVLSNKIAAGEVVSRPESVVKELMENSIDAGASNICLIIKEAGKNLIQVIDDGIGMTEADALMSFERHSTSKISTYEDLENISTLGFRGEALASIASISQVELKTKTESEQIGTMIKIEGGEFKEVTKVSSERGTSFSIKNLFYNTPGRRNFLKSNQTEFKHIYETFIKLAISNPDIGFKFINNEDTIFDLPRHELKERIAELFGIAFSDSLIKVHSENQYIKIDGYISKPNFTKKSKQDQYFYLNNRFFTSKNLNFAVYSGYDDLIEKGDYPSFFLFIETDPKKVDVNVHPSKLEVKFEEEGAVFGFIRNSVKAALRDADLVFNVGFNRQNSIPSIDKEETFHYKSPADNNYISSSQNKNFSFGSDTGEPAKITSIFEASRPVDENQYETVFEQNEAEDKDKNSNIIEHKRNEEHNFNVWQYRLKYIMVQTESGLMIIDMHAAHERILYERALLMLESQSSFAQQLLIPIKFKLTKIDFQIALELKQELFNLGFNFKEGKDETIELYGLPADVKIGNENKIFQELIDQYKEYELKLNLEKRDNLAKSFACHSAVRTGDALKKEEMIRLIDDLFACKMPYVCPHGRPTVIRITTDELDSRFSRT